MPPLGADGVFPRVVWGAVAAAGVALVARRFRALSTGGAWAAVAVGATCAAAGWDWVALLIAFFVTSSLWSYLDRPGRVRRTGAVMTKTGARDAVQVLANGGVGALAALGLVLWVHSSGDRSDMSSSFHSAAAWRALGAGALAAAAADTWATEVGTAWGGTPRSIITGRQVVAGSSGGVSLVGTLAGVAGATCLAALALAVAWGRAVAIAAALGGLAGLVTDSLLGATLQQRRWCDQCSVETERRRHVCDRATRVVGGLEWLDNDGVNALSTSVGAWIAWAIGRSLS